MSFAQPYTLASPTGALLAVRYQPAQIISDNKAYGIIQINHGLAEHSGRYAEFAACLAQAGYHVYAHDHRGHGLTSAIDAPQGSFARYNGDGVVLDDIAFINRHIRHEHSDLPIIIFGHSMGALLSLAYIIEQAETINAAALWNADFGSTLTNIPAKIILLAERMLLGSDVPSQIIPKLTFKRWAQITNNTKKPSSHLTQYKQPDHSAPSLEAFNWLSHDPEAVADYMADPYCGFSPSIGLWLNLIALRQRCNINSLAKLPRSLPLHLQGGGQDPATNNAQAILNLEKQLMRSGQTNITTKIYAEMRHESLHEYNRHQAIQDFIEWATAVCSKS